MLHLLVLFLLLLKETTSEDVVSAENGVRKERLDKYVLNVDSKRRLADILQDREAEFSKTSECIGDTEADKEKRYRKALKNDGALVEFVSADPIPVKVSELEENKSCQSPGHEIFLKKDQPKTNISRNSNETIGGVNTATTVKEKQSLDEGGKVRNKTESRRASEYQFSSVEYYDDINVFEEMCPDVIETITLEIDQLRPYDVECELMLEWRSLE